MWSWIYVFSKHDPEKNAIDHGKISAAYGNLGRLFFLSQTVLSVTFSMSL
jgi:hypothetical protein